MIDTNKRKGVGWKAGKRGSVRLGAACKTNSAQQQHHWPKVNSSSSSASAVLSHRLSP